MSADLELMKSKFAHGILRASTFLSSLMQQLFLNLLHGFLPNFSCWLPWQYSGTCFDFLKETSVPKFQDFVLRSLVWALTGANIQIVTPPNRSYNFSNLSRMFYPKGPLKSNDFFPFFLTKDPMGANISKWYSSLNFLKFSICDLIHLSVKIPWRASPPWSNVVEVNNAPRFLSAVRYV